MKKVLIISYFAPPCNLTGSNRVGSWEKYFPENRIHPIVVTRNWTGEELTEAARLEHSGNQIRIDKKENSEVHYLPYNSSVRDKAFIKGQSSKAYSLFSKVLTVLNLIMQNFSIRFIPYSNIYYHAREILLQDSSIKHLVISGNLFEQFYFGYLLKKEFSYIEWLADYRDDWTTTDLISHRNILQTVILFLEKRSEKKWLANASKFTSVSPYYVEKIANFIGKKGEVVYNGFNEELLSLEGEVERDSFFITYNGSLYPTQKIEIFLEAYKRLIKRFQKDINLHLYLPGIKHDITQAEKVASSLKGLESYYTSTDRIPRNEVIEIQLKSDVLLVVAHENIKGIPSSKIFEYIGLRKKILLCPSDHDVLDEIVGEIGVIADSTEACFLLLEQQVQEKIDTGLDFRIDVDKTLKYSCKKQVAKLTEIINTI
tara:strand:+ start:2936 stop:4219 length:1284 start_codon:yes stop_codon:yes gene_type:complete